MHSLPRRRERRFALVALILALTFSIAAALLFDCLFGASLLSEPIVHPIRIEDPVFHHGFRPNGNSLERWGDGHYPFCTDPNGFRSPCGVTDTSKAFDIGIIGDSFVEGIGLPYEETFVGRIAAASPKQRIANLGVTSYSPTVYLAKIRYLLEHGYSFSEIVVYVDISDIQDEAIMYYEKDGVVKSPIGLGGSDMAEPDSPSKATGAMAVWLRNFPLLHTATSRFYHWLHPIPILAPSPVTPLHKDYARSAWTYNPNPPGYGTMGVEGGKAKACKAMSDLEELLRSRGIAMSVGVYPWPGQLLYDHADSAQVKLWQEFCTTRCRLFMNSFPAFFDSVERVSAARTVELYYIPGDMHFNAAGNEIVARTWLAAHEASPADAAPERAGSLPPPSR